jgi:hypothetical protein
MGRKRNPRVVLTDQLVASVKQLQDLRATWRIHSRRTVFIEYAQREQTSDYLRDREPHEYAETQSVFWRHTYNELTKVISQLIKQRDEALRMYDITKEGEK